MGQFLHLEDEHIHFTSCYKNPSCPKIDINSSLSQVSSMSKKTISNTDFKSKKKQAMVVCGKKRAACEHTRVMWMLTLPSSPLGPDLAPGQLLLRGCTSYVAATEEQSGWNFTSAPHCHLDSHLPRCLTSSSAHEGTSSTAPCVIHLAFNQSISSSILIPP